MWQSRFVRDALMRLHPGCEVEILPMTTVGDQVLDRSLSKIGGKGLFVKELEQALAEGRADIAVHSAKDVPMQLPPGFQLAAIMEREDPRDCLVSNHYDSIAALPQGSVVGTSSLRREAQLRSRRPDLVVQPLRGNVDTRLAKLDRGDYAAIVLAAAGLIRLGLGARARRLIECDEHIPSPGQGALAIEIREGRDDLVAALAPLVHAPTAACVVAERAVSRALGGSCQVPLGAHAVAHGDGIELHACIGMPSGERMLRAVLRGPAADAERLGAAAAAELRTHGAGDILEQLAPAAGP